MDKSLNKKELEQLHCQFTIIDKDKDGLISAQEFCTYLQSIQKEVSVQEIQGMVNDFDSEENKLLNLNDFYSLYILYVK